jgi:Holliday junction resolvasome RuvABC endonuclease subunit
MSHDLLNNQRVLAIDPYTQGFGFALLEGALLDWGLKEAKGDKNSVCLKKITDLIEYYQPDVIVLENPTGEGSRRYLRVQELIQEIVKLASSKRIKSQSFSRSQIKKAFSTSGAFTKYQIANTIAEQFPELASRLPRVRKPWMSEDQRMSIFDAVALALTLVSLRNINEIAEKH